MFSPDGDSIRLILTSADTLGNHDANNTGWEDLGITPKMHAVNIFNRPADGNAIGQGQIFTLADGSFILVDGGHQVYDAEQVYRSLKYLNERPDGKIVIAAWILTHDHRDHSGAIEEMAEKFASEITVEQIILNNDPDTFMWRHKNAPYGYSYGTYGVFDKIEQVADQFGEDCKVVVAHMGQNMKIRNAEV
jgi:glyoxylase-like metal-dependent hydrolase (beta-lactamase superfamily II)